MRAIVLFSGGKDSTYAAHLCIGWGWEVELLTIEPSEDSMMFHHPNVKWCPLQAKAMGVPHHFAPRKTADELADLQSAISELKQSRGIGGIVTGAIASEYQRQRIELIGDALGIPTFNPLWHKGEAVLHEMCESMDVRVVSVSADGLGPEWLGRRLDAPAISILKGKKPSINVFFEGGEAETFVRDAAFFKSGIQIEKSKKEFDGVRGREQILSARLAISV